MEIHGNRQSKELNPSILNMVGVLVKTDDGHLLDSGRPHRLWFRFRLGLRVKDVIQGRRLDRNGLLHKPEEELAAAL
jgi:hypothetical protein